jgi:4-alpha-glucanotransferase
MTFERSSGILLHPTSLPSPYGIGDLGPGAHGWVDFLGRTGTGLWQVLPLGPTGYGDSPYQCFSAFAGNPYLISPESLLQDGLLSGDDLVDAPEFPSDHVDYGTVIPWKVDLLNRAYVQFQSKSLPDLEKAFVQFQADEAHWLDDYALFMTLKENQGGGPWWTWDAALRDSDSSPEAVNGSTAKSISLNRFAEKHSDTIQMIKFRQFLFFKQWSEVRDHAHRNGIQIIGDIPIFVAHDSADVWANRELFYLDEVGQPTVVAGVPPDYFSETGQLWGNPLYDWEKHAADGYSWWLDRLRAVLSLVDIVRLDHFRGFAGYWEIPGEAETAVKGRWMDGPGADFFRKVRESLGELPIIAEDLGEITPDVVELRDQFNLPGMKVLVFAFNSGPENEFLPHNYTRDFAVYTGTHDNDTAVGWYQRVEEHERSFARRYLNTSGEDIAWDLIRAAWASVAVFALAPLQDLLGLDNEARMNYPGSDQGNWTWRFSNNALSASLKSRLQEMNKIFDR